MIITFTGVNFLPRFNKLENISLKNILNGLFLNWPAGKDVWFGEYAIAADSKCHQGELKQKISSRNVFILFFVSKANAPHPWMPTILLLQCE